MTTRAAPIGWPLLPVPDADGRLRYPNSLDQSVRESMRVILSTRAGELLFHADFGAGLDDFLHQANTLGLRREIHDRVIENLARWEPRIDVDRVDVEEVAGAPSQLRIRIAYRLKRTGVSQTLGLILDTSTRTAD